MVSNKYILIVDDEPNVRLMLRTALESVGYEVIEAAEGHAALERLRDMSSGCELILLDLKMPKTDGMELLAHLRALGNVIPVVILTAHGSIPDAVAAMKLGAIDFLTKPVTPEALRRVVAEVIDRHVAAPPPALSANSRPTLTDRSRQVASDLARAKRAVNCGQFREAESLLRKIIDLDPGSAETRELLDRLQTLKEQEERGSFRILRDWFPSGTTRAK
jgi:FixJ family two-component response regulator